jgi:hypothetical protein
MWELLGVPERTLGAPTCGKEWLLQVSDRRRLVWELLESRMSNLGKNLLCQFYMYAWDAAGATGMMQVRLKCCRCGWDAAGAPGMLQVCQEIIVTTYRETIVKIRVLRLFSHPLIYVSIYLCIYIVTHQHTIYLDWLQAVLESYSRCTWK